jgi:glycosyltransferase involved in cell wall biosynthesis
LQFALDLILSGGTIKNIAVERRLLRVLSRFQIRGRGIAVVMRALEGGGAQRDMVLLCNALAAKGVLVTVLTLCGEGPLRSSLDPRIRVVKVPGRKLRYAIPWLRRAIRNEAPSIVVSSESNLNLCTIVAVRSLPLYCRPKLVVREVGSPAVAQYHDPYVQNRIAYRILRRFYRCADRIITLTEGARRDLVQNFAVPDEKIAVMLTNAVIPSAVVQWLAQWDGEAGREADLIVCVGRLSPEKDQRTLLRAMTLLPAERAWRLAIVGDGPDRAALERFAHSNGLTHRVLFTGHVVNPFAWLMRARVAVCSSLYEGLGNAIIEALACGTAVVATGCPYGPREIMRNGIYGALTPVGDAAAMAAAIDNALDHVPDRRSLMMRGLNYTPERAAERFLEIVRDLQSQPAGAKKPLAVARASSGRPC